MDKIETATYINAMVACALIEAKGMEAANQERQFFNEMPIYGQGAFVALIEKYGIHHNAVMLLMENAG